MTKSSMLLGVFLASGNIGAGTFFLVAGPAFASVFNFTVAAIIIKVLLDDWNL